MIVSFRDKGTERVWLGYPSRKFPPTVLRSARRKLLILHAAVSLLDIKVPPGNRLHGLSGNREGEYAISINDQWRICFEWRDGNAHRVEIADYHS